MSSPFLPPDCVGRFRRTVRKIPFHSFVIRHRRSSQLSSVSSSVTVSKCPLSKCPVPKCHSVQAILLSNPSSVFSSGFEQIQQRRVEKKDNLSKTKRKNTKKLLAAREAAITHFAHADAVAAEEAAAIEAAAVEVATIEAVDVVVEELADEAAVALVIGIADQHSRPRLPDFVPSPTSSCVLYRPYDRWPSSEEPPTPPGEPESEEEDFIPNLSDCEVRSEVGSSSEGEAPEPTSPPTPDPPLPPRRVVQIRNTKTNKTRCVGLDQLFRPSSQDKILRRK